MKNLLKKLAHKLHSISISFEYNYLWTNNHSSIEGLKYPSIAKKLWKLNQYLFNYYSN
jgi:hypothetical protein